MAIREWAQIEEEIANRHTVAMESRLSAAEEERARICIWCGKVCESIEALADHEEDCE